MRKHFYAHVICDNPGIYDYECIIDNSDITIFLRSILPILEQQYEEIRYSEEINFVDTYTWEDIIELYNIQYEDDGSLPYEVIWNFIRKELYGLIDGHGTQDEKYTIVESLLYCYLKLFELAYIQNGKLVFNVRVFNNSRSFAEYFFSYLKDSNLLKHHHISILNERINNIIWLIQNHNFPNNDMHEGILQEWLNIYKLITRD